MSTSSPTPSTTSSIGLILGGILLARFGLGRNPVCTLLLGNVAVAVIGMTTALREWPLLFVGGLTLLLLAWPIAEAAEQTIVQRVVPFEKQGRVLGFAQSVETASTPVAAFVIGPISQFFLIPYMDGGSGQATFGWLLGDGEARGIALTLVAVVLAFSSIAYRRLSASYVGIAEPVLAPA